MNLTPRTYLRGPPRLSSLDRHQLKILPTLVLELVIGPGILVLLAQGHRKDLAELRPVIPEIGVMG